MLRNHSHYSLLTSTSRCEQIVDACVENNFDYAGLTDVFTVAGAVKFTIQCNEKNIKPIIGCDIVLTDGSYLTLICRNKFSWKQLLRVISIANSPDHYKKEPRIAFDELLSLISPINFIIIDGYLNSSLFVKIFEDTSCIFQNLENDSVLECVHPEWYKNCITHIQAMKKVFPNYFLEIPRNESGFSVDNILHDLILKLDPSGEFTIPDTSSYYPNREDCFDHRVLICSKLKTTMKNLDNTIYDTKNIEMLRFIKRSDCNIRNTTDRKNLDRIAELCEPIELLSEPRLPHVQCPKAMSQDEYLKDLCREGWRKLLANTLKDEEIEIYKERVITELDILKRADLAGYFLIVQDYVNHFRNQGVLVGPARGSAAGSLVCYLLGITLIDPIKYGLVFSRFYNDGRRTEGKISLPDIDVDFPPSIRDSVIQYLKNKYGEDKVCQMVTFGRLAGKSILKEVLRVNQSCSPAQQNEITDKLPNEAAISDQLEDSGETSIIRWTLEHKPDALKDYCRLNSDGEIVGDFANEFKQAIRMEGIFKTQGKHAAGVVVSSETLSDICPMVKGSSSSEQLAGMEMGDLESIGCVKFDILGVSNLEKCSQVIEEVNNDCLWNGA